MYNLNQISASITGTVNYELESNSFLTPFIFAMPADTSLSSYGASVAVDGTGSYELQLIPGEYIVGSFYFTNPNSDWNENGSEDSNDMGFQLQFFENSLTLESATVIQLNENDRFEELMKEAIEQDPTNAVLYFNIGVVNDKKGDKTEAIKYYKKTIELDPNFESGYLNLVSLILQGESSIVEEMNGLGNSRADNARYDVLKTERENLYVILYIQYHSIC